MTTAVEKKKKYFRILAGTHVEPLETMKSIELPDGSSQQVPETISYGPGGIVVTTRDLNKLNKKGFAPKFEELPEYVAKAEARAFRESQAKAEGSTQEVQRVVDANTRELFEEMSLDELKAHAASEEINLGEAKTKEEILEVVINAAGV